MMTTEPNPFETTTQAYAEMQMRLGQEGMTMLEGQLAVWHELRTQHLQSPLRDAFEAGSSALPKGVLLHSTGMHISGVETLESIASLGLVSGELVGQAEDSETHGCVDFFKVSRDTTIEDYMAFAKERVRSGGLVRPRGESLLRRGITFIVDPEVQGMTELQRHDGYTDPNMAGFVRPPSGRSSEDTAAILGGVPSGAIAGIIAARLPDGVSIDNLSGLFGVPVFDVEGNRLDGLHAEGGVGHQGMGVGSGVTEQGVVAG